MHVICCPDPIVHLVEMVQHHKRNSSRKVGVQWVGCGYPLQSSRGGNYSVRVHTAGGRGEVGGGEW